MRRIAISGRGQRAGRCWDCGGPCLTYKGTVHGWRCAECCALYLDRAWATAVVAEEKGRNRKPTGFHPTPGRRGGTEPEDRRGGGGLASGRTAVAAIEGGR